MKLVAFDLDDTLAPSKSPLPPEMDVALRSLLDHVEVCIISGGQMGQFRTQVLDNLNASDEELSRLHLMPTCGTRYYRFEGGAWVERYAHDLDPVVAARVIDSWSVTLVSLACGRRTRGAISSRTVAPRSPSRRLARRHRWTRSAPGIPMGPRRQPCATPCSPTFPS